MNQLNPIEALIGVQNGELTARIYGSNDSIKSMQSRSAIPLSLEDFTGKEDEYASHFTIATDENSPHFLKYITPEEACTVIDEVLGKRLTTCYPSLVTGRGYGRD